MEPKTLFIPAGTENWGRAISLRAAGQASTPDGSDLATGVQDVGVKDASSLGADGTDSELAAGPDQSGSFPAPQVQIPVDRDKVVDLTYLAGITLPESVALGSAELHA